MDTNNLADSAPPNLLVLIDTCEVSEGVTDYGDILTVEPSPKGHFVAVGYEKGIVQIWGSEHARKERYLMVSPGSPVQALAWHPSFENVLFIGTSGGKILRHVVEKETRTCESLCATDTFIHKICIDAAGDRLALASGYNVGILEDISSFDPRRKRTEVKWIYLRPIKGDSASILDEPLPCGIAVHGDKILVTHAGVMGIRILSVAQQAVIMKLPQTETFRSAPVYVGGCISPSGKYAVMCRVGKPTVDWYCTETGFFIPSNTNWIISESEFLPWNKVIDAAFINDDTVVTGGGSNNILVWRRGSEGPPLQLTIPALDVGDSGRELTNTSLMQFFGLSHRSAIEKLFVYANNSTTDRAPFLRYVDLNLVSSGHPLLQATIADDFVSWDEGNGEDDNDEGDDAENPTEEELERPEEEGDDEISGYEVHPVILAGPGMSVLSTPPISPPHTPARTLPRPLPPLVDEVKPAPTHSRTQQDDEDSDDDNSMYVTPTRPKRVVLEPMLFNHRPLSPLPITNVLKLNHIKKSPFVPNSLSSLGDSSTVNPIKESPVVVDSLSSHSSPSTASDSSPQSRPATSPPTLALIPHEKYRQQSSQSQLIAILKAVGRLLHDWIPRGDTASLGVDFRGLARVVVGYGKTFGIQYLAGMGAFLVLWAMWSFRGVGTTSGILAEKSGEGPTSQTRTHPAATTPALSCGCPFILYAQQIAGAGVTQYPVAVTIPQALIEPVAVQAGDECECRFTGTVV